MARSAPRTIGDRGQWATVLVAALLVVGPLAGAVSADRPTPSADRGTASGTELATPPPENATVRNETGYLEGPDGRDVYDVTPREDAGQIVFVLTTPPDADFDLYATLDGRTPTVTDNDFESYSVGAVEKLEVPARVVRAAPNLTVAVDGYNGTARYALRILQYDRSTNATNRQPVAALTYRCVAVECVFRSAGRDPDGTIDEYALDSDPTAPGVEDRYERPSRTVRQVYPVRDPNGSTVPATLTVTDDDGATRSVTNDVSVYPPLPALRARAVPTPEELREELEDGEDTMGEYENLENLRDGDPGTAATVRETYLGTPGCSGLFGCLVEFVFNHVFGDGDYYYGMAVSVVNYVPAAELQSDENVQEVRLRISYEMDDDPERTNVTVYNERREALGTTMLDATTDRTNVTFSLAPEDLSEGLVVVYRQAPEDEGENDETEIRLYQQTAVVVTGNTTSAP